ncbi:MAG: tetratricopeptide repeat protein [Desulfobacteraceae bacterium]|jgi:TPR repeat protein
MKSIKVLIIAFLFCIFCPAISFAEPFNDAMEAFKNKNYTKVVELLTPLAEQNNAEAKAFLGNMYYNGDGVEQDRAKGFKMLTDAANLGYVPAKSALASIAIGKKEYEKAIQILTPLAEDNNLEAKKVMGVLYCRGYGVEQDIEKGLSLIMDAAALGDEGAKTIAAVMNKGFAELGDPKAMYNVGYMCMKGWGGENDPQMCVQWLEKAAENGHVKSAKVLSSIYSKGKYGISPDKEKASHYSSLANN